MERPKVEKEDLREDVGYAEEVISQASAPKGRGKEKVAKVVKVCTRRVVMEAMAMEAMAKRGEKEVAKESPRLHRQMSKMPTTG